MADKDVEQFAEETAAEGAAEGAAKEAMEPQNTKPVVRAAASSDLEHEIPHKGERAEMEIDDFVVVPQEKAPSHVINQDEATGFDETKKSTRFKDDTQSFSRIKDVRAEGVEVVIEIDTGKTDLRIHAAVLTDQRMTPAEAIKRAVALNQMLMLDKVKLSDRQQVEDIVEATIIAVLEAQENRMRMDGAAYEDIKRSRKARLDKILAFEAAVIQVRGKAALAELGEMTLFKKVLQKVAT